MKLNALLATAAVTMLVGACAPAGYYDSNGDYRSYGASDSYRHNKPVASAPPGGESRNYYEEPSHTTVIYDRAGYYDRNGYYISDERGPHLPDSFLPPHGMCRVWFSGRELSDQPAVESCRGIQSRVPSGAYVIYGG